MKGYENEKFALDSDKEDRVRERIDYKRELEGQQAADIARRPAEHALRENSKAELGYVKNIISPMGANADAPGHGDLNYHDVLEEESEGGAPDKQDIARTHPRMAFRDR